MRQWQRKDFIRNAWAFGLSITDIKIFIELYGYRTVHKLVALLYRYARRYGFCFVTKYPMYTKFNKEPLSGTHYEYNPYTKMYETWLT